MIIPESEICLADKVRALLDPATYPHSCSSIDAVETHFAWIFLAGDFAYKMKKPVQVERMDFRDLGARERNCREEVRLNRRLASEVYVDVVALAAQDIDTLRIGGNGPTVEWLVKMRRLPSQCMLDRAILAHTATESTIRPAADLLGRFFAAQPPVLLSAADYLARLQTHLVDSREQLLAVDLAVDPAAVDTIIDWLRSFLVEREAVFRARAIGGKIVEGHGDLRPEHVFLGNESAGFSPCVIDCLEFDRDLRIFDPLEELAFLTLECERLNAAWVKTTLVARYRAATGDVFEDALFRFYRTRRALTRAKIMAWHLRDPEVSAQCDWRALARSYLKLALQPA